MEINKTKNLSTNSKLNCDGFKNLEKFLLLTNLI